MVIDKNYYLILHLLSQGIRMKMFLKTMKYLILNNVTV